MTPTDDVTGGVAKEKKSISWSPPNKSDTEEGPVLIEVSANEERGNWGDVTQVPTTSGKVLSSPNNAF